jgi:site-specific DNA-methyltransferase (adenine-specific)
MIDLINGDCLEEMKNIPDGSVDLILTDLPYGTVKGLGDSQNIQHGMKGKTEWDQTLDSSLLMQESNRVLRKNGKMLLFAQQPFTTELINAAVPNLPFNYSMIWEKDHFANALTAKKAPLNYYEDVLIFSKVYDTDLKHPVYDYADKVIEYINKPKKDIFKEMGHQGAFHFLLGRNSFQVHLCTEKTYSQMIAMYRLDKMDNFIEYSVLKHQENEFKAQTRSTFNLWEGNKFKSNILKYRKDYSGHHPTQKPVLLLEDLIKTYSNEGNLVVDMTMGSGSTGVAAKNLNRSFIGIELDETYFNIAKERINAN